MHLYPVMMSEGITSVYVIDGVVDPALSWGGVDGVFFLLWFFLSSLFLFLYSYHEPQKPEWKTQELYFWLFLLVS